MTAGKDIRLECIYLQIWTLERRRIQGFGLRWRHQSHQRQIRADNWHSAVSAKQKSQSPGYHRRLNTIPDDPVVENTATRTPRRELIDHVVQELDCRNFIQLKRLTNDRKHHERLLQTNIRAVDLK